ncbi:metallophosphoesterase [Aureimonas psammosilenae]|uniref:metallophosphoesterase n=1 Tax=Aureimonas psammosilenae TaxID=2495496 RepID=UPI0012608F5A|nr:metallophosphoesterase [Aureimonas psammosilenae]
MPRLWVMSDIHLEEHPGLLWHPPAGVEHDVVVLAGDVHRDPISAAAWAHWAFEKPVVYVAGNHEFYGSSIDAELENAAAVNEARLGRPSPVRFLENASAIIAGVRFLGCTLWTDFELHGITERELAYAMRDAVRGVPDYHSIRGFTPADARARHLASRAWLEAELSKTFDGPTVVVTHHAPSERSIGHSWRGATTSPAYASDLELLVEEAQPDLWIHGHVHDPSDYRIGKTRVLCNPMGFTTESPRFDPRMVVMV